MAEVHVVLLRKKIDKKNHPVKGDCVYVVQMKSNEERLENCSRNINIDVRSRSVTSIEGKCEVTFVDGLGKETKIANGRTRE